MKIVENNLKEKMLNWANRFNIFCLLDNNGYNFENPAFECLLGVGCKRSYAFTGTNDLQQLQAFYDDNPSWLFGHFGYNALGNAYTANCSSDVDFGNGFFFEPEIVLKFAANKIEVIYGNVDPDFVICEINKLPISASTQNAIFSIVPRFSKEMYIEQIKKIQAHIGRGDCYELNFCQYFFCENAIINVIEKYITLTKISSAPFGAFYKLNNNYCLCASPERFLQKMGSQLLSQPIKGTSRRDIDVVRDDANKNYLLNSEKEKSENVMIVDLVRNDMSMVCQKGSVKVKELFGIYSFPQVHQMISTIVGAVAATAPFTVVIEACFPMGSMTGAPKERVMELIEKYEEKGRGLFSGSIGYITPNNDFDFNVVIRSIFYNELKMQLSFFAGSAITFYSNAEDEYDECMAKAEALMKVLAKNNDEQIVV